MLGWRDFREVQGLIIVLALFVAFFASYQAYQASQEPPAFLSSPKIHRQATMPVGFPPVHVTIPKTSIFASPAYTDVYAQHD